MKISFFCSEPVSKVELSSASGSFFLLLGFCLPSGIIFSQQKFLSVARIVSTKWFYLQPVAVSFCCSEPVCKVEFTSDVGSFYLLLRSCLRSGITFSRRKFLAVGRILSMKWNYLQPAAVSFCCSYPLDEVGLSSVSGSFFLMLIPCKRSGIIFNRLKFLSVARMLSIKWNYLQQSEGSFSCSDPVYEVELSSKPAFGCKLAATIVFYIGWYWPEKWGKFLHHENY